MHCFLDNSDKLGKSILDVFELGRQRIENEQEFTLFERKRKKMRFVHFYQYSRLMISNPPNVKV